MPKGISDKGREARQVSMGCSTLCALILVGLCVSNYIGGAPEPLGNMVFPGLVLAPIGILTSGFALWDEVSSLRRPGALVYICVIAFINTSSIWLGFQTLLSLFLVD